MRTRWTFALLLLLPGLVAADRPGLSSRLRDPAVAKALKITDEQRDKLKTVLDRAMTEAYKAFELREATPEGQEEKRRRDEVRTQMANGGPLPPDFPPVPLDRAMEKADAAARKILSADQWQRLRELDLQKRGWPALADSDLVRTLDLDDESVAFLKELKAERAQLAKQAGEEANSREAQDAARSGAENQQRVSRIWAQTRKADDALKTQALRALSKRRRARYKAMLGEPLPESVVRYFPTMRFPAPAPRGR